MKLVDLKCPHCGGSIVKDNNVFVCNSCGTVITVDYDDSDVEYERLRTQPERDKRKFEYDKALLEKEHELRQQEEHRRTITRGIIKIAIIFCIFASVAACVFISIILNNATDRRRVADYTEEVTATPRPTSSPTPTPNYKITSELISDDLDDYVETGRLVQMEIDQCGVENENGVIHFYDKTDAVFLDAYIVSDIPYVDNDESCRLVLIYEVTWHNDDYGDQTCYDAVYFDGIKVTPEGQVVNNFNGRTIYRSDAAWGWGMAYSFADYKQCYLENVKALGGTVTEVVINSDFMTDNAEPEESEPAETEATEVTEG